MSPRTSTVRVMYEVTETRVAEIPEPNGGYLELLSAVRALEPEHAHVRLLHWLVLSGRKS